MNNELLQIFLEARLVSPKEKDIIKGDLEYVIANDKLSITNMCKYNYPDCKKSDKSPGCAYLGTLCKGDKKPINMSISKFKTELNKMVNR